MKRSIDIIRFSTLHGPRRALRLTVAMVLLVAFMALLAEQPASAQSLSNDATLATLTVSPVNIVGFTASTHDYEVNVAVNVATARVMATANHSGASVEISPAQPVDLSEGSNTVTITVTAEDGLTTQTYTVTINRRTAEYNRKRTEDFNSLDEAGNNQPRGLWSNGTTMWVSDWNDKRLYAYKMSDKSRDPDNEFNLVGGAVNGTTDLGIGGNGNPEGIWSNGTTMWVSDWNDKRLYAYKMSDMSRDPGEDFIFGSESSVNPNDIWSDNTTMWVLESGEDKIYAYKMSDKSRDPDKDFNDLADDAAGTPGSIWSDGATMWVLYSSPTGGGRGDSDEILAYDMSDKSRHPDRKFTTLRAAGNGLGESIWSDGTTMWVSDWEDDKIYAYSQPVYAVSASVTQTTLTVVFSSDLAAAASLTNSAFAVKKTPDEGSETPVSLSGSPTISGRTLTLTLSTAVAASDFDIKVSYTNPLTGSGNRLVSTGNNEVTSFTNLAVLNADASSDSALRALSVSPKNIAGFTAGRRSYEVGVAATVTTVTVTATENDSVAQVDIDPDDADTTTTGHQVNLSAGSNTVTVTVTAQNRVSTSTYRVRVNRGVTDSYGWKASEDLDGLIAAASPTPVSVWSNGTTMWVLDFLSQKIFAYKMSDKSRDPGNDFNSLAGAGNTNPFGIWSNGVTMWVSDAGQRKIFAYSMRSKMRDPVEDFSNLRAAGNELPYGIWSDGVTMWVTDIIDRKVYAYKMVDKTWDQSKDTPYHGSLIQATGVWSDGTTMWVVDTAWNRILALKMSDKSRDPDKDFPREYDGNAGRLGAAGGGAKHSYLGYLVGRNHNVGTGHQKRQGLFLQLADLPCVGAPILDDARDYLQPGLGRGARPG